ncbi:MAG: GNAT family N-acetyltransferase [Spirochaetaceae bacterium]|jgi:GNAT superfamily N-acetyltransferase|nr:GNAT family N-acetyltransferase [Spirochaetaceae bacterium]
MKSSSSSKSNDRAVRFAEPEDVPLLLQFIRGLAEYEDLTDQFTATPEGLKRHLFQEKRAEAVIGEYRGEPAGFALFFHTFSTFLGKPGIYIEDLFVKSEMRGRGIGKALLEFIAKLAAERNCGRLEWACLNWNEPSIRFYTRRGAVPLSEWTVYRVTGEHLKTLAENSLL